jgi:hypothetical protein
MTAEELAELFHHTYERLAPSFGYRTREESAVAWEHMPENHRRLMIAVAGEVLSRLNRQVSVAYNLARFCQDLAIFASYQDVIEHLV